MSPSDLDTLNQLLTRFYNEQHDNGWKRNLTEYSNTLIDIRAAQAKAKVVQDQGRFTADKILESLDK